MQPIGHSAHFPIRFVVYVGSHSGHFIAVELLTGRLLWTTQFEEETPPTGKVCYAVCIHSMNNHSVEILMLGKKLSTCDIVDMQANLIPACFL